jgi:hypothetical protein
LRNAQLGDAQYVVPSAVSTPFATVYPSPPSSMLRHGGQFVTFAVNALNFATAAFSHPSSSKDAPT